MTELVCIVCPNGCRLSVNKDVDGNLTVSGNKCKRGEAFAKEEITAPKRSVTTTVATSVEGFPVVPVRTAGEIPKDKMKELVKEAGKILLTRPYMRGEAVMKDLFGTGVDLIVTSDMK